MSRKFREWKRFLKLFHNCGRDREHKATLYDYKKMRRKYQREWKIAKESWRQVKRERQKRNEQKV